MRILVVDDDRSLRDALRRALTLAEYDVVLAEGGQDGLTRIATDVPDAVVLDIGMPDIDGLEVCRRLRSSGNRVPVLILTARDAVEDRIDGLDAGADDYLVKPFDVGELKARVRALLRRSGARVLVNAMDLEDAKRYLGGSFEFMGVAVRAKEIEQRRPEMVALTKALADALHAIRRMTGDQLIAAFPKEMTTGLDLKEFGEIIALHRDALYPEKVNIDLESAKRVEQSLISGGLIKSGASVSGLHDLTIVGG